MHKVYTGNQKKTSAGKLRIDDNTITTSTPKVLDLTRKDVRDYVYSVLEFVLKV